MIMAGIARRWATNEVSVHRDSDGFNIFMIRYISLHIGSGSGGPSFGGGRPFPSNDRFRPGQQNQLQSGSGPHRGLPAMQDPQPTPQPQQQLDANDCEIVVTSKHLTYAIFMHLFH